MRNNANTSKICNRWKLPRAHCENGKMLLGSSEKAITAMQTQQQQLAMVDVELLRQINDARRESAQSTQHLNAQKQEVKMKLREPKKRLLKRNGKEIHLKDQ